MNNNDLIAKAKENTDKLNTTGELADDELDSVSGGGFFDSIIPSIKGGSPPADGSDFGIPCHQRCSKCGSLNCVKPIPTLPQCHCNDCGYEWSL